MANVILVNRTKRPRRMLTLNLSKNVAASKIETRNVVEARDGVRRKKIETKLVPSSVRIPSGGETEVPESYLGCPEVAAAIARRDIIVKRKAPQVAESPKSRAKKKA